MAVYSQVIRGGVGAPENCSAHLLAVRQADIEDNVEDRADER